MSGGAAAEGESVADLADPHLLVVLTVIENRVGEGFRQAAIARRRLWQAIDRGQYARAREWLDALRVAVEPVLRADASWPDVERALGALDRILRRERA